MHPEHMGHSFDVLQKLIPYLNTEKFWKCSYSYLKLQKIGFLLQKKNHSAPQTYISRYYTPKYINLFFFVYERNLNGNVWLYFDYM